MQGGELNLERVKIRIKLNITKTNRPVSSTRTDEDISCRDEDISCRDKEIP